jgi:hypothetical protein
MMGAVAEGDFNERSGIGVNMQEVGDDAANGAEWPVSLLSRQAENMFGARSQAFQADFEFLEHRNALIGADNAAFQLGGVFDERF